MAILGIIVLFEAARRTTGYFIPSLATFAIIYALLANILWVFLVMQDCRETVISFIYDQ